MESSLTSILFQIQCYQSEKGDFAQHVMNVLKHSDLSEEGLEELLYFLKDKKSQQLPMAVATYWWSVHDTVTNFKETREG